MDPVDPDPDHCYFYVIKAINGGGYGMHSYRIYSAPERSVANLVPKRVLNIGEKNDLTR